MISEAHHLREQAQSCVLLASVAGETKIAELLRGVARNLVRVAEEMEGLQAARLELRAVK